MTIIGREQKEGVAPPLASPFEAHDMPSDVQLQGMIKAARKGYQKDLDKAVAKIMANNPDCPREIAVSAANGTAAVKEAKAILTRNESEKKRRQQAGTWSLKD